MIPKSDSDLFVDNLDFWQEYLQQETRLASWKTDRHLKLLSWNQGAKDLLNLTPGMQANLEQWLEKSDKQVLLNLPVGRHRQIRLNFRGVGFPGFALLCHVLVDEAQILLIGEFPLHTQTDYLDQMSHLHNELIVATRDLLREKRKIEFLHQEEKHLNLTLKQLTERRNAELKDALGLLAQEQVHLLAVKERVEIAHQARTELLKQLSHELRTPLNSMMGYAQILQRTPGAESVAYAQKIWESGQQQERYLANLMELLRFEESDHHEQLQMLEVRSWLEAIQVDFEQACQRKGLGFDMWAGPLPERLMLDVPLLMSLSRRMLELILDKQPHALQLKLTGTVHEQYCQLTLSFQTAGLNWTEAERRVLETEADAERDQVYQANLLGLALSRHQAIALGGTLSLDPESQFLQLCLPPVTCEGSLQTYGTRTSVRNTSAAYQASGSANQVILSTISESLTSTTLLQTWEQVRGSLVLDEVEDFLNALSAYALQQKTLIPETTQAETFQIYLAGLRQQLQGFDLEALATELEQAPAWIRKLDGQPPDSG